MNAMKPKDVPQWRGRFVDVRNLDECAAERLPAAECVPLSQVLAAASNWDRSEPILLMCKSGMRASQAAAQLESVGFTDVHTVEGGIDGCRKAGLAVVVTRKAIPVFRQVMIGAGVVVLLGLLLSWLHPWFIAIDWFVGLMLVIGGFSGFCPMALILARMPWNAPASCSSGRCA